jgi:hypothetical protein
MSSVNFRRDLVRENTRVLIFTISVNLFITIVTLALVNKVTADEARDVLATSAALLGITTATLVFFGSYVGSATDALFGDKTKLKDFPEAVANIPKVLLNLIFLQFVLWWSLIANGISTLLGIATFYIAGYSIIGTLSLCFLLIGILTILIWMSLFILSNTPGKWTYSALARRTSADPTRARPPLGDSQ